MPQLKRYLLFTVDTEPDDPLWRGLHRGGWTHENLRGLPRLASVCRSLGIRPTFFISHSAAVQVEAAGALLPLLRDGACEVGTHLHPGDTPPFREREEALVDNILKVPDGLLEEKFASLHWEVWSRFGRPTAYRSAAWTLDGRLVRLLERHGYRADSSVTPGVSWRLHGRPSYLDAPPGAYRLGYGDPAVPGGSGIVEVPVSVWSPGRLDGATLPGRVLGDLFTMPLGSRSGPAVSLVKAVRPSPPQWIRPAFRTQAQMEETAGSLADEEFLHVMCHSNELWPGASPYVKTRADLDAFYLRLEGFFRWALDRGYRPATVSGYAGLVEASGRLGAGPASGARAGNGERSGVGGNGPVSAEGRLEEIRGEDFLDPQPPAPAAPASASRRAAMLAGKAAVSLAALALAAHSVDWQAVGRHLERADPAFAAACLGGLIAEIVLNAFKIAYLVRPARLTAAQGMRANCIKVLFNNFLPAGIGGEAARVLLLGRKLRSLGLLAAAVTADRLSGLWTQVLFTAVSLPFLAGAAVGEGGRWLAAAGAAGAALGLGWLATGPGPVFFGGLAQRLPGMAGRAASAEEVERFRGFWRDLLGDRRRLAGAAAFSLVSHLQLILTLWLAVRAFGGSLDPAQAAPILLFASLTAVIPLSLGGIGIQEGSFALAFALAGSRPELGFLVSLLLRVVGWVPALAGAFLYLRGRSLLDWRGHAASAVRVEGA